MRPARFSLSFIHEHGAWRRLGPLAAWLLLVALVQFALSAKAQGAIQFTAQVDQPQVEVGEPIHFTLDLSSDGAQLSGEPSLPDLGGLTVRSGPTSSYNTTIINNAVQYAVTYNWVLAAPHEGKFTIGPASMTIDGQTYQSNPVSVMVARQPAQQGGDNSILSAQTEDASLNGQLKGRLFLRAVVSNKEPYVGEPVVITYSLYNLDSNRIPLVGQTREIFGDIEGALRQELFHAKSVDYQSTNFNGQSFQAATLYRIALIPNKTGKLDITGSYQLEGTLRVRRSPGPSGDPFFDNMDSFFGNGVRVTIPSPPIQLNVRPLPTDGQPRNFTGTVGDFTMRAGVDRTKATEDDLVTLKLALEGKGAIDMATPPTFPAMTDFEIVGQNPQVEKQNTPEGLGGRKTFEYVLRPKRAGQLQIPAIDYPIFNPAARKYVTLRSAPIALSISPGKAPSGGAPQATLEPRRESERHELNYIKPLHTIQNRRPERLMDSPLFWLVQALAFALLALAWQRNRNQAHMDPARMRRSGAWRGFQRRLTAIRQQMAGGAGVQETAGQVDQASRGYIADRFNLAPDGLTRPEIERLLLGRAVPRERVQRLCDLIDRCAALRYAPLGSTDGELASWIEEIAVLLKENVRE